MYYYLIFIFLAVLESNGQESCFTITSTDGQCIKMDECPVLYNLLDQSDDDDEPLPAETINTLRRSQCGVDGPMPKVCCPFNGELTPELPNVTNHPYLGLLDYVSCGQHTESRIIGGNQTGVLDYPWMALLSYNNAKSDLVFECGGSLISKRYVLTAAHCVTALPEGMSFKGVRLGEHDLTTEQDCEIAEYGERVCAAKYQDFLFEKIHVHEGFSTNTLHNDIALIKLDRDAEFRNNSAPICLPIGSVSTLRSKRAIVTGWGFTENETKSPVLLQANLPIVPIDKCIQAYQNRQVQNRLNIWPKQLCAGGANRTDSCTGDSGGPMQVSTMYSGQVKVFQYGVVSFGPKPCAVEGLPTVYTSVAHYMDWILDHMTD